MTALATDLETSVNADGFEIAGDANAGTAVSDRLDCDDSIVDKASIDDADVPEPGFIASVDPWAQDQGDYERNRYALEVPPELDDGCEES